MSLFSYIAFPREADIIGVESRFDPAKAFTVSEIRGTPLEADFHGSLDSLPGDLNVYTGDIFADFQGIQVYDKGGAAFRGVFDNLFIYSFAATFALLDEEKYLKECAAFCTDASELEFAKGLVKHNRESVALCRSQLCQLVLSNVASGEKVEIYSEWVSGVDFDLGPPTSIVTLGIDDIDSPALPDMNDRLKIEIMR